MMSPLFTYSTTNHVLTITLNRPEIHNAFNDELIEKLTDFLLEKSQETELRLLCLTGAGKSFSAGADLNWMKKMKGYSEDENLRDAKKLALLFSTLNSFPTPVLAKVKGAALGGGSGLVAVCDYVLAEKTALFGFTEAKLGLIPAVISPYVMAKIGESQARALFLSGMKFKAERALHMGLIHQVCAEESSDQEFDLIIREFLTAAPKASREAKRLIRDMLAVTKKIDSQAVQTNLACERISRLRIATEGQEGMSALLEKRKAEWIL
jgi:methylglutaconyl-CoA hydratase